MSSFLLLLLFVVFLGAIVGVIDPKDESTPKPKELTRVSNVTMKRVKVRLDLIVMDPDRFCHRNQDALKADSLKSLMDSLITEGMQVPIEGYFDKQGRFVVVKGHRRVSSLLLLVQKNTPSFTADMEVDAIELENYTQQDLLVRSIADNEVRLNLDRTGRIRAAKKLHDAGVEESRAAAALGVSVKTYQRDLLIAKHNWMFEHVMDGNIDATAAIKLLEAAEKHNRIDLVKEDLNAWVADHKSELRKKEKLLKLQGRKEMSPAEKQVKNFLKAHILDHWLDLIAKGQRFDEDAEWDFAASLDLDKRKVQIGSINLDLDKDPPEKIAKVASKLSYLCKQMAPFVKKRVSQESSTASTEEAAYDLDYL
jgi:ParB-like chromosome segregation protein Spo0J